MGTFVDHSKPNYKRSCDCLSEEMSAMCISGKRRNVENQSQENTRCHHLTAPVLKGLEEYCLVSALLTLAPFARQPEYAHINDRYRSFDGWPYGDVQEAKTLAQAGFYWTGREDRVRCFMCKGGLCNWEKEDIALYEHAKWFGRCGYIQECIRNDVVIAIIESTKQAQESHGMTIHQHYSQGHTECDSAHSTAKYPSPTSLQQAASTVPEPVTAVPSSQHCHLVTDSAATLNTQLKAGSASSNSQGNNTALVKNTLPTATKELNKMKEENEELRNRINCKVCLDQRIAVIFLPCSHLVCCVECSLQLTHCPLCRQSIKATAKVFV